MIGAPPPVSQPVHVVQSCVRATCLVIVEKPYVGGSPLRVHIAAPHAAPMTSARVTATVDMARMRMHPEIYRLRSDAHGTYSAPVALDMPGHWRATITVRNGRDTTTIVAPFFVDLPPTAAVKR